MNAITEVPAVSAQTLEHILGSGDLSKLSTQQRVEYYAKTCQSLGLNPLTRPFRFLALNGQIQLYATRDCTDQLRKVNGITLHVVDRASEAGVYSVTVRARDKHGREDEDIGAVVLPQSGESRANALMKAITKAKRRVTLSICGLGLTDEAELDTMPGAMPFDAEDEPPVVPLRAAAASTPRPAKIIDPTVYDTAPKRMTIREWLDEFERDAAAAQTPEEAEKILKRESVLRLDDPALTINQAVRDRALAIRSALTARIWPEPPADTEETWPGADADSAAEPAHA